VAIAIALGGCGRVGFGGFCANATPPPTFCADFDESSSPLAGWTGIDNIAAEGPVALDTDHVSSPRSLIATVTAQGAGAVETARVFWEYAGVPATAHLELDMKPCALQAASGFLEPIAFIEVLGYGLELQADAAGPYLHIRNMNGATPLDMKTYLSGPIAPDVWHHVAFDVAFDAIAGSAAIAIDGSGGPSARVSNVRTITSGMTWVRLYLGLYAAGSTPACATRYDDVVLSIR
jgi:hypothetical protein